MGAVLVTGADGFIGRRLMVSLTQSGFEVRGAVRNSNSSAGVSRLQEHGLVSVGDLAAHPQWDVALSGVDCVIHLAARAHVMRERASDPLAAFRSVNTEPTCQLIATARRMGIKQFIYVSSAGVLGNKSGVQVFDDATRPNPVEPYAVSKLEAEECAHRDCGAMPLLIIRPPLVYGPGNKGNFLRLLKLLSSGIPVPLAAVTARRSMIYVDNLTAAIVGAASCGPISGRYLVSDGTDLSLAEICEVLVRHLPNPSRLCKCPQKILDLTLRLVGRGHLAAKLFHPLLIDSGRFCKDLRWTAPFKVKEGLISTAAWYSEKQFSRHCSHVDAGSSK